MKKNNLLLTLSIMIAVPSLSFGAIEKIRGTFEVSEDGHTYIRWRSPGGTVMGELSSACNTPDEPGSLFNTTSECISNFWVLEHRKDATNKMEQIPVRRLPSVENEIEYLQVRNRVVRIRKDGRNHTTFDRTWDLYPINDDPENSLSESLPSPQFFIRDLNRFTKEISGEVLPDPDSSTSTIRAGGTYLRISNVELNDPSQWKPYERVLIKIKKSSILAMWQVSSTR